MKIFLRSQKLNTEFKTIKAMVNIYCKKHHEQKNGLCSECGEFVEYALKKLDRCPYGETKPNCNKCPIHCYKQLMREQAHTIMRYAGPRMLFKHPILAIKHLLVERAHIPKIIPMQISNRHLNKKPLDNNR